MRVFRCISAREITNTYKGKEERIAIAEGENTHIYKEGNYIHFFRYSQFAEYYFQEPCLSMTPLDQYVLLMVANIPKEVLEKYHGYGFYLYRENELNGRVIPIPEYAIPEEEMKPEYVVCLNTYISQEHQSNGLEYMRYLNIVKILLDKHHGKRYEVVKELEQHGLQNLLGVEDDDKTEEEHHQDKAKIMHKILSNLLG